MQTEQQPGSTSVDRSPRAPVSSSPIDRLVPVWHESYLPGLNRDSGLHLCIGTFADQDSLEVNHHLW